jgi:hypothetical protein
MPALFLGMLAVLAQMKLAGTRRQVWAVAVGAAAAAAIYTQPFAVFAPASYALYSVWRQRDRGYAALTFAAYAGAIAAFLPWALFSYSRWTGAVARVPGGFDLPGALRVLLRECAGDGYAAAVPVLLLAAFGARKAPALAAAPIAAALLALASDAAFDYFFAIRQVIYAIPFLLLAAATGAASLWNRQRTAAALLVAVFAGAALEKDYRHLADHNEDWARLSAVLLRASEGGCILLASEEDAGVYAMFQPGIAARLCGPVRAARVALPVHPYASPPRARLLETGMALAGVESAGFASVEVFKRSIQPLDAGGNKSRP